MYIIYMSACTVGSGDHMWPHTNYGLGHSAMCRFSSTNIITTRNTFFIRDIEQKVVILFHNKSCEAYGCKRSLDGQRQCISDLYMVKKVS